MKSISCSSEKYPLGILDLFFHSTKNFVFHSQSFPFDPSLLHLSYCCIRKILTKLLQPTVSGLVPPPSPVLSPETTLLLRHPLQLFPHPLWFCFDSIIFFLRHSILFLSPFILKSYYLLSLQSVQRIKRYVALPCSQFYCTMASHRLEELLQDKTLVVQPYNYYSYNYHDAELGF